MTHTLYFTLSVLICIWGYNYLMMINYSIMVSNAHLFYLIVSFIVTVCPGLIYVLYMHQMAKIFLY